MEKTDRQREPNHRNALRARLPSGRFAPFAPPLRVGLSNGWPAARHLPGAARRAGASSTACAHIQHRAR
ncbi:hypothetical protein [Aeromonas sp. ASNIH3]|uniref:hypothetical protein n=1 Tax=Aeromonas sp. ASNIH3 TaxID=1636608 RepID=UPI0013151FD8|nr:hypothetical protein [Aeromonas sp. ASNIH3]